MLRNLRNPWLTVSILLGLIQVWDGRFVMSGDGISYLDMGQAYLRGDWHTAINGFWNPLYAWLQAIGYVIFRPSPYWEYPVVQIVNFVIYFATACAFEYFLILLVRGRDDETGLRFIAYALFLWSSLHLIGAFSVNPDMLLATPPTPRLGSWLATRKDRPLWHWHCPCFGAITPSHFFFGRRDDSRVRVSCIAPPT